MKILKSVMILSFSFILFSCGNNSGSNAANTTSSVNAQASTTESVKVGDWASGQMAMKVTEIGANYRLPCSAGTIDQPLTTDETGHFHATGTFTNGVGPISLPPPTPIPVKYDGVVNGDNMTLTVTSTENGSEFTNTYNVGYEQPADFLTCL